MRFESGARVLLSVMAVLMWGLFPGGAARAQDPLPETLHGLNIQDGFVPVEGFPTAGRIDALEGSVVVIHRSTGAAYYGKAGDAVYENDALETLAGSRCRIRFQNEDVVTMAPGTRFGVDEYREQQGGKAPRSFFSMLKGKAMFYALRLFSRGERQVTVKTPTAVAGVRGTKFGVDVYWVEDETAGLSGPRVAALEGDGLRLGQAGPGGTSFTNIFSEDGVLDVNGQTVAPGSMYRGRDGAVVPTPPGYVRQFEAATEVGMGGGGGDTGDEEAGEEGDAEGDGSGLNESAEAAELVVDTSLLVNEGDSEDRFDGGIAQGKTAGRVSGIMALLLDSSKNVWIGPGKGPVYEHGPTPLGDGADTHVAYEVDREHESDFELLLQEQDAAGTKAQVTKFDWGTGGNRALGTPRTFTYFQGGTYSDENGNDYMEWGWWEDTNPMGDRGLIGQNGPSKFFAASNKIWHVEGDRTHPDYVDYLRQQEAVYDYSGESKGVFVDNTVPTTVDLSGTFSCRIDFGSRQVSDLHIDASGGGYGVHLTTSAQLDPDGEIDIHTFSGTIGGNPVTDSGGGGVVLGPKADGVGGAWRAHDGGDYWAVGEYHGRR